MHILHKYSLTSVERIADNRIEYWKRAENLESYSFDVSIKSMFKMHNKW